MESMTDDTDWGSLYACLLDMNRPHLHVRVDPPPLVPRNVAELVPLCKRGEATETPQRRVDVRGCSRVAGCR